MMKRMEITVPEREFAVHEECGIFGVISPEKRDLARETYFGLFALQHRGQESAGIAVTTDGYRVAYYKNMGLLNEVFGEKELSAFPNTHGAIGHVRYSTTGSSNVVNAQPVVFYGRYGRMAIAHNGNIVNSEQIKERMLRQGHIFQSSVDSEVVAALINDCSTENVEEGVMRACSWFAGGYALLILAGTQLIAVRDPRGLKPLIMGKKGNMIVFASESCAFDAIDAVAVRNVEPGEVVVVDQDGRMHSRFLQRERRAHCIFEYVYLARCDSEIDGVGVYESRYRCGKILAELYKIDADIVAGVPDSALVSARGYSEASGIPYVDALSKNRYIGRTFIQPTQSMRENSVKIKLNAVRANIKGKRLILIDDSIVRGTTSKKIISLLRSAGAREVHMLIASPIVKYPCYFGVDMQTKDQLIGHERDAEQICKEIGADSLHYIPLDRLKEACGNLGFCAACFDGNYPMNVEPYRKNKDVLE